MTNEEASFCMKQYLPDSDSLECMKCPYYHTVPIEGMGNGFTCKADEAHKMAIKALEQGDVLREIWQKIVNLVKTYPFIDHKDAYVKEDEVLEIIDKRLKELSE